ncbi:MAG: sulfur oxidase, partial [Methanolinea sp.]|nr:sulfur oxidase [Methanolinea sp.]
MKGTIFLTTESLSPERLTWLAELMKYYSTRLYPESLRHHPRTPIPCLNFFLSGDAVYSLIDRRCSRFWEVLFTLPPFRCIFDTRELMLRGISIEPQKVRSPDQIIPSSQASDGNTSRFWDWIMESVRDGYPGTQSIGFLQLQSPYMHRSSVHMVDLLSASLRAGISPELYGYLDGIHTAHIAQRPAEYQNIGEALCNVNTLALKKNLVPRFLLCSRSATERGYSTFEGETGKILSRCTIPPMKVREIGQIAERFSNSHVIFSHSCLSVKVEKDRRIPAIRETESRDPPPLVILATKNPYGTGTTLGAVSFAVACAHREIATRVVFLEDGVYALTGHHSIEE